MSAEGTVHLAIEGQVASVTFDRPEARNAMTWGMYERLREICEQLREDRKVRVVRLQGAGGEAFVAGTDIAQFQDFDGQRGIAYERQIDGTMQLLASLPMPTVAVVQGWCIGGGLAIASTCDFRLATPGSKFGVPIARTLGNCLSMSNLASLVAAFGRPRVQRLLLLADMVGAEEAASCGYVVEVVAPDAIEAAAQKLCTRLASLAPVTQQVSKEALARLLRHDLPEDDDLI
ncbi:MAG TPA: enoyl-CoA hydratase/isomerase family protein, partial [Ramlibacter sp.]|nr:enoyl-CoA hydratase/isomerase family protein [Ramlibacter sp.]